MTTKNNLDFAGFLAFFRGFLPPKIETGPLLSAVLAFLVSTVVILVNTDKGWGKAGDIRDFETGRVADRDVVADRPVVYVDEDETIMRVEAQEKLVPAVFRFSPQVTEKCRNSYQRFRKLAEERFQGDSSPEFFVPVVLAEFPAFFSAEILGRFFDAPDRSPLLEFCAASLDLILEKGVFSFSGNDFGGHNPEEALVLRPVGARVERERVLYTGVITKDKLRDALGLYINAASAPSSFSALGAELLLPFISENVFYSPEDTEQLVAEIRRNVAPVEKYIERGKRVIKKGYLITEDDMKELRALRLDIRQNDVRRDIARILILLFLFLFLLFFSGARIIDRSLTAPETYLVIVLSSLYLTGSILVRSLPEDSMPVSLAFPTALAVMLPAILIHARLALILAMALPLGAFLTGSFDTGSYIIALVSGVTASWVLQGAEKRMDLIQGGLIIAAANCVASLAVLLLQHAALGSYPQVMFWAAFNGLGSGMLVLGFLPPLEHALNAATTFRLIELSDLNSPILKRLFTAAPGT